MKQQKRWIAAAHNSLLIGSAALMGVAALYLFVPSTQNIDPMTTATISDERLRGTDAVIQPAIQPDMPHDPALDILKTGLSAFDDGDIDGVRTAIAALENSSVDRALLQWLLATSGNQSVSADEIRTAQEQLAEWPHQNKMAENLERAATRGTWSAMRLRFMAGDEPPATFQAAFAIARTHLVTGGTAKIRALLTPYWHTKVLSARDENLVLETFGDQLTTRDHEIRFFNMMARERVKSAGRLLTVLDAQDLHKAWSAVIRRQGSAGDLLDALPDGDKKTMAYQFMRTELLRRAGKDDEAIKIIDQLPESADALINPDVWWDERRIISRHKFEEGDFATAYKIVAAHTGGTDKTQIDAAFHAGWYALRGLNDPAKAAPHFEKITKIARGNISKARGYYWLGRASSGTAATEAFEQAAKFSSTYYGQLASAALGRPLALAGQPSAKPEAATIQPLLAINRLNAIGQTDRARALYVALGWHLDDVSQIRAAADNASRQGDHYAALKIAKAADWRGIDVGDLTHPIGAISQTAALSPQDRALAYAVARQESEFNVSAVSRANAKGILQVLPGTAREMAKRVNLAYQPEKLTRDAGYNARLGTAYLNQQLDRFDGSYVLTFAAYNAGPARAKEWIERFGDPRGKPIEQVIDWVEQIPFPETRSYVQRILENLQVYKLRLGQDTSIVKDLQVGRSDS